MVRWLPLLTLLVKLIAFISTNYRTSLLELLIGLDVSFRLTMMKRNFRVFFLTICFISFPWPFFPLCLSKTFIQFTDKETNWFDWDPNFGSFHLRTKWRPFGWNRWAEVFSRLWHEINSSKLLLPPNQVNLLCPHYSVWQESSLAEDQVFNETAAAG